MTELCDSCKEKARKAGKKGITVYDLCPSCYTNYVVG